MTTRRSSHAIHHFIIPGALCATALCAPFTQKTWDGECGSTEWQCDDNWEPNGIPGSTDDVMLSSSDPVISIDSGDADGQSVTIESGLVVDTTGNVTFHGTSSITNLQAGLSSTSRLVAQAEVSFNGDSISSGVLDGPSSFVNDGVMTVDGTLRTTLENNDTMIIDAADLAVEPSGLLRNNGTMLFNDFTNVTDAGGMVENNGTIQKNGGSMAVIFPHFSMSSGTIDIAAGTFRLDGPVDLLGGSVQVQKGAQFNLTGSNADQRNLSGNWSGSGQFDTGPEITVSGPITADMDGLFIISSTTTLDADLTNTGNLELEGLTFEGDGTLINAAGATMTTDGGVVFNAAFENNGAFIHADGITINDFVESLADSTWTIVPGGTWGNGSDQFATSSAVLKIETGGIHVIPIELDINASEVIIEDTEVRWQGGGEANGSVMLQGTQAELNIGINTAIIDLPLEIDAADGTDAIFEVNGTGLTLDVQSTLHLRVPSNFDNGIVGSTLVTAFINNHDLMELGGASFDVVDIVNSNTVEVTGHTDLNSDLFNEANGVVDMRAGTLDLQDSGHLRNSGLVIMTEPSTFTRTGTIGIITNFERFECFANTGVSSRFNNADSVLVGDGATLTFFDAETNVLQISNGVIDGGRWEAEPGAEIIFDNVILHTIGPGTTIIGSNDSMSFLNDVSQNDGDIFLNGGTSFQDSIDFLNNGTIRMSDQVEAASGFESVIGELQSIVVPALTGDDPLAIGLVTPVLTNGGSIVPGGPDATAYFGITGTFEQTSTGTIDIELNGDAPGTTHDQLVVTGDCTLAGQLDVTLLDGFELEGGESFVVLRSLDGTITGTFDTINSDASFSVDYQPNQVIITADVTAPCPSDLNDDDTTDVNDLLMLLASWGIDGPGADIAAPLDIVDVNDLLILLGAWGDC